jgi:hypothetical protein
MRSLLIIIRPRDLPEFIESQKHVKIDKLWINYYHQEEAFLIARKEALKRDYTHYFFIVDDNIITQADIDLLLEDSKRYNIISGWMNADTTDHKDQSQISLTLPPDPPYLGSHDGYHFMPISHIEWLSTDINILNVKHQGFALTLMTREILENIGFRDSHGCCIDSCFSLDIHKAGIKQYVDLRVRIKHLKENDKKQIELLKVGKKPRRIVYDIN